MKDVELRSACGRVFEIEKEIGKSIKTLDLYFQQMIEFYQELADGLTNTRRCVYCNEVMDEEELKTAYDKDCHESCYKEAWSELERE